MNRDQLDLIPDNLLGGKDTARLTRWLWERGWRITLLELDSERRARGLINAQRQERKR